MSAHSNPYKIGTLTASEDLSSDNLYRGVVVSGDGTGGRPSSQGDVGIGVNHNLPKNGEALELAVGGISKLRAGEAISGGDRLTVDSNGDFVKATSNDYVLARAITKASGSGVIFSGLINNEETKA
jgi:hypothetical protein